MDTPESTKPKFNDLSQRYCFGLRTSESDAITAERALINYVAYHKLNGGEMPGAEALKRLGLALGMRYVNAERVLSEAKRTVENARGTAIERAAKKNDVSTAFSLMDRARADRARADRARADRARADRARENLSIHSVHKTETETVKDLSQKAVKVSLSIIRGIRSCFRKIERATRPTE